MMEENTVHKRNGKRIDIGAPIKGSMMHFNSGNRQMKGSCFFFQINSFHVKVLIDHYYTV